MKFAGFTVGQQIVAGPVPVTEGDIVRFAREWDPQWFHTDPARAAASRWNGLIASGWHTASIAMRIVVDQLLADSESFGSPGLDYLKWLHPVRPGDLLTLRASVLEARTSARQPTLGVLRWRWQLCNQDDVAVLDLVATSLFDLSAP